MIGPLIIDYFLKFQLQLWDTGIYTGLITNDFYMP
jgi:hypothetical protein